MTDQRPSPPPSQPAGSSRVLWWGAAGSGLLMLAGLGAFAYASQVAAGRSASADTVTVTLADKTCQPNDIRVPAGPTSFRIVNQTDRAVEWEILDGVMVVEERENIAPGLSQTLTTRLKPGTYAITCGLLSNPRGQLVVTPASGNAAPERPALVAFIGPLAEYQVYLALEARDFVRKSQALGEAIRAGDLAKAKALYAEARAPYLHLAPVAGRMADLANAIDPLATYLEKREADPGFTGFHRIEYGLFARSSLDGLAPVAAKLEADAETLRARLRTVKLAPDDLAKGAARSLRALADSTAGGGTELYARTDLADFEAVLAGTAKIATLLKPVAEEAAPQPFASVDARLSALQAKLAALEGPSSFPGFDTLAAAQREALATDARALADSFDQLNTALGTAGDNA